MTWTLVWFNHPITEPRAKRRIRQQMETHPTDFRRSTSTVMFGDVACCFPQDCVELNAVVGRLRCDMEP